MSAGELGMRQAAGTAKRVLPARMINMAAAVLVVLWSWKWLPPMAEMVRTQTEIGRGVDGMPNGYAIFELVFVASHYGVRWLPGVVAIVGAAFLMRWWLRRA